jgi:hypothetical protein
MSWLIDIALGTCLIILVCGLVSIAKTYAAGRSSRKKEAREAETDQIEARLDEIERRLTDVQDVMIALSEKFDHWEGKKSEV